MIQIVIYYEMEMRGKGGIKVDAEQWVKKAQKGDRNAFEPLIHMYQQKIFSFCYYMLGQKQEAEDAVQDVFLKAYKHIKYYRYDLSFSAWLYKIATNHCKTLLKRKQRWNKLLPLIHKADSEKSAEQVYGELTPDLSQWLMDLSPIEKQILLLRVLEEKSFNEIGVILDQNPATLRKRYERIKKKIEEKNPERRKFNYEKGYSL
jgi:RNA polymerase sigma-70 factor (ECF subfamily)